MRKEQIAIICHEANRTYCQTLGDFGPEASHMAWMKNKVAEGWTYGEVKDTEKKTHPCMAHFDLLPPEQQAKDKLFRNIVHSLRDYLK